MRVSRPSSLKRRLIVRLLAFQIGVLVIFGVGVAVYVAVQEGDRALVEPDFTEIAASAIVRDAQGRLQIADTEELRAARRAAPDLWFVARSDRGERIAYNTVPDAYKGIARDFDNVSQAYIKEPTPPYRRAASIRSVDGPAGRFTILAKSRAGDWSVDLTTARSGLIAFGTGSLLDTMLMLLFVSSLIMIPFLVLLAIITIVATPLIVRRAFVRLSAVAGEASRINIDRRGVRLPSDGIPSEIVPLVEAMNGALCRLDEGYDRHQRFLADAAHELRTPIAILQAKIEASGDANPVWRLRRDVARLALLAEQMLDLQRIDRVAPLNTAVDLAALAQQVVADLAPLVISEGGDLEFVDLDGTWVQGDPSAIARVLANLIQNAIEHGGRRVVVRLTGAAIEVEDDGPGIPAAERERVFEPFHRLRPRDTGSGLGLNLVRQVMSRHGGSVEALESATGGTIMRLEFTVATQG